MDTGSRLASPTGRGIVVAAVLGSGVALLDGTVVNVALPHIGEYFRADLDTLQWTINGYTLTLAAIVLLGGALGDRFGRRRVFLVGVVWFGVASVLCGLAPGPVELVVARCLQGIGAGLLTPGSLAIIQASIHPEDRAAAIGAWSGLGGVAAAAGPLLGGWLVDAFDWRWVFFINVPLVVASVVAAIRWVPESRDDSTRGRFDVAGGALAVIVLGGLTYSLVQYDPPGPAVIAAGVAVVGFVALLLVERRAASPVLPPSMFADRQFSGINAVTFFVYAGLGGIMFFLVMQLQVTSGFTALQAGVSTLPFTVAMLLFSARAGRLGQRIGPRVPLTVGPALVAAGTLALVGVGGDASYWSDVLPGVLLVSAGMTVTVAPLTAGVLAATDTAHAGVASGVNNAIARAASLLAVAALPLLVGLTGDDYTDADAFTRGYRAAMTWCAGLFAVGSVVSVLFVRTARAPVQISKPGRTR